MSVNQRGSEYGYCVVGLSAELFPARNFFAGLFALIPAAVARRKGYSFLGWWCYGFLIWIAALPHALLLRPKPGSRAAAPKAVVNP